MSTLSPGRYELSVIALLASNLSKKENVEDYNIFCLPVNETQPFNSILVEVKIKETSELYLYVIRVKAGKDKLNINKYMDAYTNFLQEKIKKHIDNNTIQFWYFCSKRPSKIVFSINEQDTEVKITNRIKRYDLHESLVYTKDVYNLLWEDSEWSLDQQSFLSKYYLFLNQPHTARITDYIKRIWDIDNPAQIVEYIRNHFINCNDGLSKATFEYELVTIRLYNYILTPTPAIPVREASAKTWNELTLCYDVTIISSELAIEQYLFGYILQKISDIVTVDDWNNFVNNEGKLSSYVKSKFIHHAFKVNTLKELMIYLWINNQVPLLLKAESPLPVLKTFLHLRKSYIIIDSNVRKRLEEMKSYGLKAFTHLGDDHTDKLLNTTLVSMQGRKPVSLYTIINGNKGLVKDITCSQFLDLLKLRQAYIKKKSLECSNNILFLIETTNSQKNYLDEYQPTGGSCIIYCRPSDTDKYCIKIRQDIRFETYAIYCLQELGNGKLRFLDSQRLDIIQNSGIHIFDQYGYPVYCSEDGTLVPIIGRTFASVESNRKTRYLRTATISKLYLKSQVKQICLFSGNLDSLNEDIKFDGIDFGCDEIILTKPRHYINKREAEKLTDYWNKLSGNEHQVLDVCVRDGKLELLRFKNCSDIDSYISFDGGRFSELDFFQEIESRSNGITIIIGDAGVGKSSLLKSLCRNYDPQTYVVFFDLHDLEKSLLQVSGAIDAEFLDFLLRKFNKEIRMEYINFIYALHENRKIVFVLDSFDEILGTCDEKVLELIQYIESIGIRIIIAVRSTCRKFLLQKHNVQVVEIEPMNVDGVDYFTTFNISEILLESLPSSFLTNPLHLSFLKKYFEYQDTTKISILTLYRMFIETKIKYRFERIHRHIYESDIDEMMSVFEKLALVAVLGRKTVYKLLMWSYYDEKYEKIKYDIVTNFDQMGNPNFQDPNIVDCLCGQWIIKANKDETKKIAMAVYKRMLDIGKLHTLHVVSKHFHLHKAIIDMNVLKVKEICEKNPSSLKITDELGRSPLHMAAICCRCSSGSENSLKILEIIILQSRVHNCDMSSGDTIMDWNWFHYIYDSIHQNFDFKAESELNLLHIACIYRNLAMAKHIVDAGMININAVDKYDYTPLGYSIFLQNNITSTATCSTSTLDAGIEIIKLLLENGADTNQLNNDNETPLHMAVKAESMVVVQLLLHYKADANIRNICGRTPLHLAAENESLDIAKLLLSNEADANIEDKYGATPICVAEKQGNENIIIMLESAASRSTSTAISTVDNNLNKDTHLAIPHKAVKRTKGSRSEQGMMYQYAITTLLAAKLLADDNVRDYAIYSSEASADKFDDIIARIELENPNKFYLCLIQVKFKETKKLRVSDIMKENSVQPFISDYIKSSNSIINNENLACRRGIKSENIRFSILSNSTIQVPVFVHDKDTVELNLEDMSVENTITESLLPFSGEFCKFSCKDTKGISGLTSFLNQCYLCLRLPDYNELLTDIQKICEIKFGSDIVKYVQDYFNNRFLHMQGLNKNDFGMEVQKLRFTNFIVSPTDFIQVIDDDRIRAWNKIISKHDVTIVDGNANDIARCLLGCWVQGLTWFKSLLNLSTSSTKISINDDIVNKFLAHSNTKDRRYWLSLPNSVRALLIELWKCGDLPLILKTDCKLSYFEKYRRLRRRYIIIDNIENRCEEISRCSLKLLTHVNDIRNIKLRKNMLQSIEVSLQGRKPNTLQDLIGAEKELMAAFSCADILATMKTRKPYLKPDFCNGSRYLVFLIEDENLKEESIDENDNSRKLRKLGDNIKVYSHPNRIDECINKIRADVKYKHYRIQRLKRVNSQYQLIKGNSPYDFKNCFIDQYGDLVYNSGEGHSTPIIGQEIVFEEHNYICRYLRKYNNYADFTSNSAGQRLSEVEFLEWLKCETSGITVITGDPGMGKSCLLKSLCNNFDTKNYILYYDLINFEIYLEQDQCILEQPIDFLFKQFHEVNFKNYSRYLGTLHNMKKLTVVLDSFDEIVVRYQNEVLKFIENIQVAEIRIMLACRLMGCNLLAKKFNFQVAKIEPLNNHTDDEYLGNWGLNKDSLLNVPSEFTTNPLYLNFLKLMVGSQEKIENNKFMLYEKVVRLKIKNCFERTSQRVRESDISQKISLFEKLALITVLGKSEACHLIDIDLENLSDDTEFGIVIRIDENGPTFCHFTFVEFLLTRFIKKYQKGISKGFAQDIYKKLLADGKLPLLNIIFDHLDLHEAIAQTDIKRVERLLINTNGNYKFAHDVDAFGRTPLHIAAICCRNSNAHDKSYKILRMTREYMQRNGCEINTCDTIMGWDWIQYIDADILKFQYFNDDGYLT